MIYMNNEELEKKKIEILLDNDDLSFEQLVKIKNKMISMQYSASDIEWANCMLEDCFESMNLEELIDSKNYIESYGLDNILVDKYIKRKAPLSLELINSMEKDDILYIMDYNELPLEFLVYIKKISEQKNFTDEDNIWLEEKIDECIEDIDSYIDAKNVMDLFYKYNLYNEKLDLKLKSIKSKFSDNDINLFESDINLKRDQINNHDEDFNNFSNVNIQHNSVYGELLSWDLKRYLSSIPIPKYKD